MTDIANIEKPYFLTEQRPQYFAVSCSNNVGKQILQNWIELLQQIVVEYVTKSNNNFKIWKSDMSIYHTN